MKNFNLKLIVFCIILLLSASCVGQTKNDAKEVGNENKITSNKETMNKIRIEDISAVMVSLEIENKNSLFVLLAKDGSINRLGTGTEDNKENSMYIGITSSETFEKLIKQINPKFFDWNGEYGSSEIKGKSCKLMVGFKLNDGTETGSVWNYGTQSQGPPPEIREFVVAAVEATEPWYEEQKKIKKP